MSGIIKNMTETPESRTEPAAVATTPRWNRPNRLNQVAAWVGIVAGVVFIVAVIFFSGFYTGKHSGGRYGDWYGYGMYHHGGPPPGGMADRAASIMPFDLNATTHTFTKTDNGGVQQVVANDQADQTDITLIRQHLQHEADQFAAGNYADPATIHGADMPGLHELQSNPQRVQVHYEEIPAGARITYSSTDPALIAALHCWFDAQTHDHNMPGMGMGH